MTAALLELLVLLEADAGVGLFAEKQDRRRSQEEMARTAPRRIMDPASYQTIGDGCYRHLCATNADGEHYEDEVEDEADAG